MTSPGHVRTAAARAARTRAKHDRWSAELASAGRIIVQTAGDITISLAFDYNENSQVALECCRCRSEFATWENQNPTVVPLPAVLAAVNGHTCEAGG